MNWSIISCGSKYSEKNIWASALVYRRHVCWPISLDLTFHWSEHISVARACPPYLPKAITRRQFAYREWSSMRIEFSRSSNWNLELLSGKYQHIFIRSRRHNISGKIYGFLRICFCNHFFGGTCVDIAISRRS